MKINRLLLLAPPAYTSKTAYRDINPLPPMGLGYLASMIKQEVTCEVKILDCLAEGWNIEEDVNDLLIKVGISDETIEKKIKAFNPDIVGIGCQFSRQYQIYNHIFALIKKINPNCIVVAGGAHATVCPQKTINDPNCDFVIIGEGEEPLKNLLVALNNNQEVSQIDGLIWKKDGVIHTNEKKKWLTNLDLLPFPAYHLMNLEMYFGLPQSHGPRHKNKFMPIITSRGCPAKCTFCTAKKVWGDKYRARSVENVIEEMRLLKNKYGIEEIMFEDDNVTANPKRAKELFSRMIEEKFNFVWDTPNGVGVWSIDEEMLDLMQKSGCVKINLPVESGSQKVLTNIIKKPLNLDKVKRLIAYCRKIDLDYGMFLVMGMPGETIKDMWKSFKFAAKCKVFDPHISVATPYPGSELLDNCLSNNYFTKKYTLDDLFIRSYMITTPEWGEKELRRTLAKGKIYLHIMQTFHEPQHLFWIISRIITSPKRMFSFLRGV
jgi:anaerobic magnesium-protoporphyrin IX monomethyl ester cyclase